MRLPAAFLMLCGLAGAAELRIAVSDETGKPIWTRLEVRDSAGKMYQAPGSIHETMTKARGGKPFYLGSFIVNGSAVLDIPPGTYTLIAEHGTEYERAVREVTAPADLSMELKPWIRMAELGWWSGDMHVHHSQQDAVGITQAEHLNFTVLVNRGKQEFLRHWPAEALQKVSDRYWISLRNIEDERRGGSWIFNGLKTPLEIGREGGWFPQGLDYVRQAQSQGAWFDIDMPFWWEVPVMVALGKPDSLDILHNQFLQYGIDESEYWGRQRDRKIYPGWQGFVDYSMELYYRYLNLGYRIPPSAGTGTGVMPSPTGYSRLYAKLQGPFTPEKWYQAIRDGQSFVTNGPMLLTSFENGQINVTAQAREAIDRLELVANGKVIETVRAGADSKRMTAHWKIAPTRYSWCAVRCILKTEDTIRMAHSSPIYLAGNFDARSDADYFVRWIDELITITEAEPARFEKPEQRDAVLALYRQAREIYAKRR